MWRVVWLGFAFAQAATGCAVHNRLGLAVHIEHAAYAFDREPLEWWAAVPEVGGSSSPVVIFVEGDGGQCQEFSERLWRRFLVRYTGRFVLVRARTLVNTLCGTNSQRWLHLDFLHRVDELDVVVDHVRRRFPRGPLVLLGHSAGAHVARLYAERHPGKVAGLVDLSGGYAELSAVLRDVGQIDPASRDELAAFAKAVPEMAPDHIVWNRTARFWQQMLFSGVGPLWMSYHKPCLVLHGIEDEHRVPWVGVERDARAVARAGGSCALEALPGAGHDTLTADTFARIDAWLRVRWPD